MSVGIRSSRDLVQPGVSLCCRGDRSGELEEIARDFSSSSFLTLLSWMASVGLPETDDRLGDGGEWGKPSK